MEENLQDNLDNNIEESLENSVADNSKEKIEDISEENMEQQDVILNKDSYGLTWYEHAQPYLGSHRGMRYRISRDPMEDVALKSPEDKGDAEFLVIIWPEPFCFEKTSEELKFEARFPFTVEGKVAMIDWLNEQYTNRKNEWTAALERELME